jgi:hypothetical protein
VVKRILYFFALAAALWTGTALTEEKNSFTADQHKALGLTCAACHKEEPPKTAASGESCLACHTSMEAVAERTKDFEKSPHKNHLVETSDIACTDCHHGHQANTSLCDQCHTGFKFEKKQAEAK